MRRKEKVALAPFSFLLCQALSAGTWSPNARVTDITIGHEDYARLKLVFIFTRSKEYARRRCSALSHVTPTSAWKTVRLFLVESLSA